MTRLHLLAILLALAGLVAAVAVAARLDAVIAVPAAVLLLFGVAAALRWPSLFLYLYAASIPLNFIVPPGPGGTVSRVVGLIFVVGYLLRRFDTLRLRTAPPMLWLLVGWMLATTLWALDQTTALSAWLSLAQLAAVTVLVASIVLEDPAEIGRTMWAYSVTAIATAMAAIVSYLQNPAIFLTRATAFDEQDPALFASALVPAAVYLIYRISSPGSATLFRLAAAGGSLICIAAILLSGTRSAWLALVATALVWLALRPSVRLIFGFATLVAGVIVVAAAVPGAGSWLAERAGSAAESGGAGRTDIWTVGLTVFSSNPINGVGLANFPMAFTEQAIEQSPVSVLAAEDIVAGRGSHNVLIAALVEAGIIGAALLVATFSSILVRTGRAGAGIFVQVTLVALFVQALLLDILFQKQLWLILGFAMGLAAYRAAEAPAPAGLDGALERLEPAARRRVRPGGVPAPG